MILTKFMFLDSKYLHSFFDDQLVPPKVRSYIDQWRNCEDIAMNFLVADMSQLPPIKASTTSPSLMTDRLVGERLKVPFVLCVDGWVTGSRASHRLWRPAQFSKGWAA